MRPQPWNALVLVSALLGLLFAAFSTRDFVAHLDRQVHSIQCSFVPGLAKPDASGTSGCHVTLLSPYSSVLRQTLWGGVPIALPAMAVFSLLLWTALSLVLRRKQYDPWATGVLFAYSFLPLIATWVYGYLSLVKLDALCKLCVGIYVASLGAFVGAWWQWRQAKKEAPLSNNESGGAKREAGLGLPLLTLVAFVLVPVVVYAAAVPDFSKYIGACGTLQRPADPFNVLVPVGMQTGSHEGVEVLDPLCPACKGFEERLKAADLDERVRRRALLFPMDKECNWMVDTTIHPGACAVSEAVLCSGSRADEVLAWAFENQQQIMQASRLQPQAAADMAKQRFPELSSCIGSPTVRARLNRGLRWGIANQLPVVTPQLYVDNTKLCDEDTDLGLDYALSRLLDRQEKH